MRFTFMLLFSAFVLSATAQTVVTLTQDTILADTWIFTENTIVRSAPGQNYTIDCSGECLPTFMADNCQVLIEDVSITQRAKRGMAGTKGEESKLVWNFGNMKGALKNGIFSSEDVFPNFE